MQRSQGIRTVSSSRQPDNGASIGNFFRFKPDQVRDRNVVRIHVSHKSSLQA